MVHFKVGKSRGERLRKGKLQVIEGRKAVRPTPSGFYRWVWGRQVAEVSGKSQALQFAWDFFVNLEESARHWLEKCQA